MRHGHKVEQTTWCGNQDITPATKFLLLLAFRSTAVRNAWSQHGSIAQATSLIEDLGAKLAGWSDNQDQRLCANRVHCRIKAVGQIWTTTGQLFDLSHELGDSRDEVGGSLARS